MQKDGIVIHADGGARGNPGPAACAFVVEVDRKTAYKASKYLGVATNNVAEYEGVIFALDWLIEKEQFLQSTIQPINFYMDSELIVNQLNGLYRVKDKNLRSLFFKVGVLVKELKTQVFFRNIPRSKNKIADSLVNENLDKQLRENSV